MTSTDDPSVSFLDMMLYTFILSGHFGDVDGISYGLDVTYGPGFIKQGLMWAAVWRGAVKILDNVSDFSQILMWKSICQ